MFTLKWEKMVKLETYLFYSSFFNWMFYGHCRDFLWRLKGRRECRFWSGNFKFIQSWIWINIDGGKGMKYLFTKSFLKKQFYLNFHMENLGKHLEKSISSSFGNLSPTDNRLQPHTSRLLFIQKHNFAVGKLCESKIVMI